MGSCVDASNPDDGPDAPKTSDPACPDVADGESYYACLAEGCQDYVVKLDDNSYTPGASTCGLPPGTSYSNSYDPAKVYDLNKDYTQPDPPKQNKLVYAKGGDVMRKKPDPQVSKQGFKHSEATVAPDCPNPIPSPIP